MKNLLSLFVCFVVNLYLTLSPAFAGINDAIQTLAQQPQPEEFSFIVFGDSQFMANNKFRRLLNTANERKPNLVLQVGDLILANHSKPDNEQQWRYFRKDIAILSAPFFPIVGNHDILDPVSAEVWHDIWGPRHYSFDHGNCHFVCMDSEKIPDKKGLFDDKQFAWLKKDLAATKAEHVFVFFHKPFWANHKHRRRWKKYHRLFRKSNVRAVFTGHKHIYQHRQRDGIDYFITVAVLSGDEHPEVGRMSHGIEVKVNKSSVSYCLFWEDGETPVNYLVPELIKSRYARWVKLPKIVPLEKSSDQKWTIRNPLKMPAAVSWSWKQGNARSLSPTSGEFLLKSHKSKIVSFNYNHNLAGPMTSATLNIHIAAETHGRDPFHIERKYLLNFDPDPGLIKVKTKLNSRRIFVVGYDKHNALEWLFLRRMKLAPSTQLVLCRTVSQLETDWPLLEPGDIIITGHLSFSYDPALARWYTNHKDDLRSFLETGGSLIACMGMRPPSQELLKDYGILYRSHDFSWKIKNGGIDDFLYLRDEKKNPSILSHGLSYPVIHFRSVAASSGWYDISTEDGYSTLGVDDVNHPVIVSKPVGEGLVIFSASRLNSYHHMRNNIDQQRIWINLLYTCLGITPSTQHDPNTIFFR
ncbi:MAG: metallophosphoesterase [Kiritimatiellae bacterium]|nr:metallophosphoesterase [Kiritimatiellia bacterium]